MNKEELQSKRVEIDKRYRAEKTDLDREYAKANKCEKIKLETNVKRIRALAKLIGFDKLSSNYCLYI